jgi:hypothetical protein
MSVRKKSRLERLLSFNQHRKRKGASSVYKQTHADDFSALKSKLIKEGETHYTHGSSKDIQTHISSLREEFSGQSELLYYHAQLIVYIRREFKVKENVAAFEALWETELDYLLKHLNTRWLVSAADTFVDHSNDPLAKSMAMNVITLVNTIKLHETERYLQCGETNSDDSKRRNTLQSERVALPDGMSAFAVGTDDTLRNMRWRLEEVSKLHFLGKMLIEVFNRLQNQESVYKRFRDRHTRKKTSWWDE